MKLCDLHTHSICSDGSLPPEQIIRLAEDAGLSAVALTDHNTSKGLAAFMEAGRHSRVIPVPGCEFSTEYDRTELHIVGLFFSPSVWPEIEDHVQLPLLGKQRSNEALIEALQRDGYAVTAQEAAALCGGDVFNRSHVARVLVAKGYADSVKTLMDGLLREGGGYYVPARRLSAIGTIKFIKTFGGAAVLAHPFLNMDEAQLTAFLPEAKAAGLDAIETRYTTFDEATSRKADALAERFGLLPSGGSDFHGDAKPDIALGVGYGNLAVPFSWYESLREKAGA